jgi:3',5'-cyclic AMP phosphodiesterase CpdA
MLRILGGGRDAEETMATLTWLHLSDWHQQGADFDRDVVRDALIADLAGRAAIDPSLARVDFVAFSGDLAWTGRPEEYEAAQREFLDPVLAAVDLQPDRLVLVPGNHDLDRAYA